jgi:glycosyltransferase involved in cell wall biosynthesis
MKTSLITVCYNSEKTIEKTIQSVISQEHDNLEYIIIDGGSTDNTINIINKYKNQIDIFVSEKDRGIYDAINKGIKLATGDIIGILNSDDQFYSKNILTEISAQFEINNYLDAIIGDIVFEKSNGKLHRYYTSSNWKPKKLEWGMMPPHPTFYCKRELFFNLGFYREDIKIAADYELLLRFLLVNKVKYTYIPKTFVKMSLGGISTKNIYSNYQINKEVLYACKLNNVKTNLFKIYSKYFFKILEFI